MKVLVYIEQKDGAVRESSLEALGAAQSLAASEITGLFFGRQDSVDSLGVSAVLVASEPNNWSPEVIADTIASIAKNDGHDAVVIAATSRGKEIAPRVATKMHAAFLGDVLALENREGLVAAKRSLYGGKLYGWFTAKAPVVITTRPKMFSPVSVTGSPAVSHVDYVSPSRKAELVSFESSGKSKADLTEADIIVSGGRGMKGPENFAALEELASAINGVVGASRAAVDAGWREHSEQVGQTGKVVAPQVYIAVGISGAIQHLAGMSASKVIIAINKDPEAPIFRVADYGIVGDALRVVPALTEEIRKQGK
ncbi:MAG: electron transfer flavoprotein subunit alpha/FixB family protein [Planctomycetota bacterium]